MRSHALDMEGHQMAPIAQPLSDAQAIADLVVVLRLQLDRALCLARLQDCQPHVESRHAIGGGGQRLRALVEVSHHMFGLIEEHVPSLEGEHLLSPEYVTRLEEVATL